MRKFVLLLVLLLALPAAAMADDSQFIEHEPFALDDSWVEGSTRPGEYHYYPFIVEEVGLVTVRVQMFCGGHVELLDADLIEWDEGYFNGTIGAPETQDFVYYLEPGVYCLRNGSDNSQGDFRIKGIFEPCPSTETAESDDYLGAQALPSGETLSGVLTEWDGHDFYTFTLDAEEQVYLTANTTLESLMPNLTLYDSESAIANELKGVIYEKLRAGETREQIFDFMVARYGEQIRYEPDMNAGTAALWAAPWVALGACGLFLAARMRRKGAKADRA